MLSLTLLDWIALAVFGLCWVVYALVVDRIPSIRAKSVIAAMDEHRRRWMISALPRENRIPDIAAIGNLMSSVTFLATTAIFILGGLVAMLAPFAVAPNPAMWELKIALLLVIFVRAFFELTWALRQFNYCSIVMGGIAAGTPTADAERRADMAAKVANRAARHFNTGLRAYYFGLAALAWIVHPLALIAAVLLVGTGARARRSRQGCDQGVPNRAIAR